MRKLQLAIVNKIKDDMDTAHHQVVNDLVSTDKDPEDSIKNYKHLAQISENLIDEIENYISTADELTP